MDLQKNGLALVDLDEEGVDKAFRADVLAGLSQPQKAIPARWLYDDAGSRAVRGHHPAARILPDPRRDRDPRANRATNSAS